MGEETNEHLYEYVVAIMHCGKTKTQAVAIAGSTLSEFRRHCERREILFSAVRIKIESRRLRTMWVSNRKKIDVIERSEMSESLKSKLIGVFLHDSSIREIADETDSFEMINIASLLIAERIKNQELSNEQRIKS